MDIGFIRLLILMVLFINPVDLEILYSKPRLRHVRIDNHDVDTHNDIVVERAIFSWSIDDEICLFNKTKIRGIYQTAYRLTLVEEYSYYCRNENCIINYDSGRIESSQTINIKYEGPSLISDSQYKYSIQYWSSTGAISQLFKGHFRTPLFNSKNELTANWIGSRNLNMNELRREFFIRESILSATVFMSGMGYGTLYVNGINVDPSRCLDPGWTTYTKRVLYVSYDIKQYLIENSTNCIGVRLGLGFYTNEQWGGGVPPPPSERFGPPVRLILQANIIYNDKTTMNITSDETWMGREGPHRKDSIYMGTFYDRRAERYNWSTPGFVDRYSLWLNASIIESPLVSSDGQFKYQTMDPIRISPYALHISTSASKTGYKSMPPGVIGGNLMNGGVFNATLIPNQQVPTYDLSQNIAGYCTLTISGRKGMTVTTRHSELLNNIGQDGIIYEGLYAANYQIIKASDDFIIEGNPHEVLSPLFTYHGFRYISIYANYINIESVVCAAIHSETTLIGNFTSSSLVINQIQHNIQWSQLSNIMSIITDCSQRQERRGWLGDASLSVDAALFNFDLYGLYVKFLDDIQDVQHDDGSIPDTAPYSVGGYDADPSWGHAYPQIALTIYYHYNDTDILKKHYLGIELWIDYLTTRAEQTGLGNMYFYYGDWVTPAHYPITNGSLVSSYSYLTDVQIMITISKILNNQTNVNKYTDLYNKFSNQFHKTFYNSSINGYGEGYQTGNVLALTLPNVVPSEVRTTILKSLVDNIIENNFHSTTGIVGTSALYPLLSQEGYHDLAVRLATETTYPSFGYMFNNNVQNATTIWETYEALYPGSGGLASLNHHMFNNIGAWFYRYLAGIQLYGFNQDIIIHPRISIYLNHINAELHTIKGSFIVSLNADFDQNFVIYNISLPNSINSIVIFEAIKPNKSCLAIYESDILIWKNSSSLIEKRFHGIHWIRPYTIGDNHIHLRIQSGNYLFQVLWN